MTFTAGLAASRDLSPGWGTGVPPGMALTDGDNFTVTYEGEIYLEAGAWTFYASADDPIFVDVAQPASTVMNRDSASIRPVSRPGRVPMAMKAF